MPKERRLQTGIKNLNEILFGPILEIPGYQRPYKWTTKNVNQLIDDILLHNEKSAYRLGTVVLHKDGDSLNIVDGQQRLYTLSLIAIELLKTDLGKRIITNKIKNLCLANSTVSNPISIENLNRNHQLIQSRIKEFLREDILFFFEKCQLVYIELDDISEAFQFFDSQNTRGKDLAPHDLLKAFHLREMTNNTEQEKLKCVSDWEEVSESLSTIFSNYLFKIRRWSKGYSGLQFSKNDVDTFKGISIEEKLEFNYLQSYRINHFYIDNYNNNSDRRIDLQKMSFPFQIDQVMINGKRFFEYVHYYSKNIKEIENLYDADNINDSLEIYLNPEHELSGEILEVLRTYKGQQRQGDKYVRNVFDCSLLYYRDKFGLYKIDDALVKLFLWSFSIRLENQAVQQVTCDNFSRLNSGVFRIIRESLHPKDILHKNLPKIRYVGDAKAVKGIGPVVNIFIELNLIEE
jgi:hypothetical protein